MRLDLSLSPTNTSQIIQNYSLSDPELVPLLKKKENYSFAKGVLEDLIADESLLIGNQKLIRKLIKLIKPDDLNDSLGEKLLRVSQKLRKVGVLRFDEKYFLQISPNLFWMVSEKIRNCFKFGEYLAVKINKVLLFHETTYSSHAKEIIIKYMGSGDAECCLKDVLQAISSDSSIWLLDEVIVLAKTLKLDGFEEDFEKTLKKCQQALLEEKMSEAEAKEVGASASAFLEGWRECAEKEGKCVFDMVMKKVDYYLERLHKGIFDITIDHLEDLDAYLNDPKSVRHLAECRVLKLKGLVINKELLEKLENLPELESLDLSMCQLDAPFYLFYKFPSLKSLSLPVLSNEDESISNLRLLAYHGTKIHLPPEQMHLLGKSMLEAEVELAQQKLEAMIFSVLDEKTCGSYLAFAEKYHMNHLLFASNFYITGRLESIGYCAQMLDFFIAHPFLIDVLPRLRDHLITSLPVDFAQWEEYREKGKRCGFDALVKQADYCLLGLHKDARHIRIYNAEGLNPYLDDRRSVKSVELLIRGGSTLKTLATYFPAITSLKFDAGCYGEHFFLERFKKLENLHFTNVRNMEFLLQDVPNLKFLTVQKGLVDEEAFKKLSELSLLEKLDLRGMNFDKKLKFNEVLNLNHLKELKLSLNQLLEISYFSTSTLDDLCKKGVLVEIDETNLDLSRRYVYPENVTDLCQYAKRTKNHILEDAFKKQLKVDHFLVKENKDLQALIKLNTFEEFSCNTLSLFFHYDENNRYRLQFIEDVLGEIVEKGIWVKKLNISNGQISSFVAPLSQKVFDLLGQLRSLEKITLQFLSCTAGSFDLSPLLQLPSLKKLKIPFLWLENSLINSKEFYPKLWEKNVKLTRR